MFLMLVVLKIIIIISFRTSSNILKDLELFNNGNKYKIKNIDKHNKIITLYSILNIDLNKYHKVEPT